MKTKVCYNIARIGDLTLSHFLEHSPVANNAMDKKGGSTPQSSA